jgi:hypothetical protein
MFLSICGSEDNVFGSGLKSASRMFNGNKGDRLWNCVQEAQYWLMHELALALHQHFVSYPQFRHGHFSSASHMRHRMPWKATAVVIFAFSIFVLVTFASTTTFSTPSPSAQ